MRACTAAALALGMMAGCRREAQVPAAHDGGAIYAERCAICHGAQEEGRDGYPRVTGSEWVKGPPEQLAAIILDGMQGPPGAQHGGGVMPGWGRVLDDAEIARLMTWLRGREGLGGVGPVEVKAARIETAGRNSFWTAEELRGLGPQ